jgi:hypothetical protein
MALTMPLLINTFVMPAGLSLLKGLIGYGMTFGSIAYVMLNQRHRINHISG